MLDELSARQQAIRMRLAGEPVSLICKVLKRSEAWVFKWWQRYVAAGYDGLYELSRAHTSLVNRTPAHVERAVVSIRRRLAAHATPQTRYALVGAATIRAELEALGYAPLPSLRTIDRILQRSRLTNPPSISRGVSRRKPIPAHRRRTPTRSIKSTWSAHAICAATPPSITSWCARTLSIKLSTPSL